MAEFINNLLQNTEEEEERPSGNLFDSLKTEEDSCDSFENFEKNNADDKLHLFMFYAPWCVHCKRKKKFLNGLINNYNNDVKVHTYNCERLKGKDKSVEQIQGFPTFKMGYKKNKSDTDLLEFVVFTVALATKFTIKKVIDEMLNPTEETKESKESKETTKTEKLKDKLKDELKKRRDDLIKKFKNKDK